MSLSDPRWHEQMSAIFGDYNTVMKACKMHRITIDKIYPGVHESSLRNYHRHLQQQQQQQFLQRRQATSRPSPLIGDDLNYNQRSTASTSASVSAGAATKGAANSNTSNRADACSSSTPSSSYMGAASAAPCPNSGGGLFASASNTPVGGGSSQGFQSARTSNCGGSLGWSPADGSETSPYQQQQQPSRQPTPTPPQPSQRRQQQEAQLRHCLRFFRRSHRLVAADARSPPLRPLPLSPEPAGDCASDAESTCTLPCLEEFSPACLDNVDYASEARQVELARLTAAGNRASSPPCSVQPGSQYSSAWEDPEDAPLSHRFPGAAQANGRRRRAESTATTGTTATDVENNAYRSPSPSVTKRARISSAHHSAVKHSHGLTLLLDLKLLLSAGRGFEEAATQTEEAPPPLRPTAAVPPVQSSAELAAAAAAAAAAASTTTAPTSLLSSSASATSSSSAGDSLLQLERLQSARADAMEQRWQEESREALFRRAKSLRQQLESAASGGQAEDRLNRRHFLESAVAYLAGCWVAEDRRQMSANEARRIYRDVAGFVRQHGRAFSDRDRRVSLHPTVANDSVAAAVASLTEVCVLLLKSLLEYRIYFTYRSDLATLSSAHRTGSLATEREAQLLGQLMPLYHANELWSHMSRQRDKLRSESADFARLEDDVTARSGVRPSGPADRLSNSLGYLLAAAEVIASTN